MNYQLVKLTWPHKKNTYVTTVGVHCSRSEIESLNLIETTLDTQSLRFMSTSLLMRTLTWWQTVRQGPTFTPLKLQEFSCGGPHSTIERTVSSWLHSESLGYRIPREKIPVRTYNARRESNQTDGRTSLETKFRSSGVPNYYEREQIQMNWSQKQVQLDRSQVSREAPGLPVFKQTDGKCYKQRLLRMSDGRSPLSTVNLPTT